MLEEIDNKLVAQLEELENKVKELKVFEEQFDEVKNKLKDVMLEKNAEYFITPHGLKFTLIKSTPRTTIDLVFNVDKFKTEHPDIYNKYVERVEKTSAAKKPYLRMSIVEGGE